MPHKLIPVILLLHVSVFSLPARADIDLSEINLPPGFEIEVWTDEVPNARSLALGADGTVFVSTRRDGRVYAVVDRDNGARDVVTLTQNLKMPNGIAFHDGDLYVAENHRIIRYRDIEDRLQNVPEPEVVIDDTADGKPPRLAIHQFWSGWQAVHQHRCTLQCLRTYRVRQYHSDESRRFGPGDRCRGCQKFGRLYMAPR